MTPNKQPTLLVRAQNVSSAGNEVSSAGNVGCGDGADADQTPRVIHLCAGEPGNSQR